MVNRGVSRGGSIEAMLFTVRGIEREAMFCQFDMAVVFLDPGEAEDDGVSQGRFVEGESFHMISNFEGNGRKFSDLSPLRLAAIGQHKRHRSSLRYSGKLLGF